jgi:hypothetical protein
MTDKKATIGFDSDWADAADSLVSQRSTTSSRTPGRENRGAVTVPRTGLRRCPDCDRMMNAHIPDGRHSPVLGKGPDGKVVTVNCRNQPLSALEIGHR